MKKSKNTVFGVIVFVLLAGGLLIGIIICNLFGFEVLDVKIVDSFKENKANFIEAKDYLLKDTSINEVLKDSFDEKQKGLHQIFRVLEYRGIHEADTMIYFVKESKMGFTQGIAFSTNGVEPFGPYITQVTKIEDGWFLFKYK